MAHQDRLWTLWFDVVPTSRIGPTIDKRLQQGFRQIKKMYLPDLPTEEPEDKPLIRKSWRSKSARPEAEKLPDRDDLDLINDGFFELEIGGDVRLCDEDTGRNNLELKYMDRSPENYRRFFVEPLQINEGSILTGFLKCYVTDSSGDKRCVRSFDFDVGPETVAAYHYVEPEPEPEPEEPEIIEPVIVRPQTPPPPPPQEVSRAPPPKPVSNASFSRLTKPTKPPKKSKYIIIVRLNFITVNVMLYALFY